MIQVDKDIRKLIGNEIKIVPFDSKCLGTNSYDVHLASTIKTYVELSEVDQRPLTHGRFVLDCKVEPRTFTYKIPPEGMILYPGCLYLAATIEYTEALTTVPFMEGKSSLGRLGLSIHVTAGKGDVGYVGEWTLEMTVVHPVRVYSGMPCGQLIFHGVSSVPDTTYTQKSTCKYSNNKLSEGPEPTASKMYLNFEDGVPLNGPEVRSLPDKIT